MKSPLLYAFFLFPEPLSMKFGGEIFIASDYYLTDDAAASGIVFWLILV